MLCFWGEKGIGIIYCLPCISYSWVIAHEETNMENLCFLDHFHRSCWRPFQLADTGGNETLQRNHRAAATVSTQYRVSNRLGHSVCSDGNWSSADLSGSSIQCPDTQSAALPDSISLQFLLEYHLFQSPEFWVCISLADCIVGSDSTHDPVLPQG